LNGIVDRKEERSSVRFRVNGDCTVFHFNQTKTQWFSIAEQILPPCGNLKTDTFASAGIQ
jgi:hypothetical protein